VLRCGYSTIRACVTLVGAAPVSVEDSTFYTSNDHLTHERLFSVTNNAHASFVNDVTLPNSRGGTSRPGTVSWNSTVLQQGGNFPPPRMGPPPS
jgi:hypothetical protein